jgi:hypothetical protein
MNVLFVVHVAEAVNDEQVEQHKQRFKKKIAASRSTCIDK